MTKIKCGENLSTMKINRQNSTLPRVTRSSYDGSRTVHGLPDPRGSLLASVPSRTIAKANRRGSGRKSRDKRGPYVKLSSPQRCEIAKYADQHGAAETARHFSRKLGKCVNESTMKSIKKAAVHSGNFRRYRHLVRSQTCPH